jgi:hypothetical protein
MREKRDVWVCEFADCGHVWLVKTDGPPRQCGKCRRPGWHKTATTAELIRESPVSLEDRMRQIATEVYRAMQPAPTVCPQPVAAPIQTPRPAPMVEDTRTIEVDVDCEGYQPPAPQPRYAPTLQPAWSQPAASPPPPSVQPLSPAERLAAVNASLVNVRDLPPMMMGSALLADALEADDDIYAT